MPLPLLICFKIKFYNAITFATIISFLDYTLIESLFYLYNNDIWGFIIPKILLSTIPSHSREENPGRILKKSA